MSMNIYIFAKRTVVATIGNGTKKTYVQTMEFSAFDTPTAVTKQIINSDDPKQAYIDWVLTAFEFDEMIPVYADDDIWEECDAIDHQKINIGQKHVAEFNEWLKEAFEDGYHLQFEMR